MDDGWMDQLKFSGYNTVVGLPAPLLFYFPLVLQQPASFSPSEGFNYSGEAAEAE